jgi:hypothetical protein
MYQCKALKVKTDVKDKLLEINKKSDFVGMKYIVDYVYNYDSVYYLVDKGKQKYLLKTLLKNMNANAYKHGYVHKLKRAINEHLACLIYQFYGISTVQFKCVLGDEINVAAPYVEVVKTSQKSIGEIINGVYVDFVVGNVSGKYGVAKKGETLYRLDVGSCLAYRTDKGLYNTSQDINVGFYTDVEGTKDHEALLNFLKNAYGDIHMDKLIENGIKTLRAVDIKKLRKYEPIINLKNDLMLIGAGEPFVKFVDDIIGIVEKRHIYYLNNPDVVKIKKEGGAALASTSSPTPADDSIQEAKGVLISSKMFDKLFKERMEAGCKI